MMDEPDAKLVARVRRGDRGAAAQLAHRYLRASRAVALAIVRDVDSAEDVCQDAFVYAIGRIDDCREPARFGAWLMQIVRNRSRNVLRDSKDAVSSTLETAALPARDPAPDVAAERAEIRDRILAALRQIPVDRAAVVLLHDLEGWTHDEIAARLEMPPGTIRSHLHHARKRLRELLHDLKE